MSKIYILYDCCSSENIAYFSSREKAEKYMNDMAADDKTWHERLGYSFDEQSFRSYYAIVEATLDEEYTNGHCN